MCGIFAYTGTGTNAADVILDGLKTLEYRGYDSWGLAVKKTDGTVFIEKRVGKIGEAKIPRVSSKIGLGHTRWATHGGVTIANSHPHTDCHQEIIIVHNGIVENFEMFKKDLSAKGHIFLSETDSEVIAHLIEDELKRSGDFSQTLLTVFKQLAGLNAIIAFYPKLNQLVAIKNGSPLILGQNKKTGKLVIASDQSAVLPHSTDLYFLQDNELLLVERNTARLSNLSGSPKSLTFEQVSYDEKKVQLDKYPHYMIKEISEQPDVLASLAANQEDLVYELAARIKEAYGTYFIGCGTAYYAALAGTYLFSSIAKRHANVAVASEFSWLVDFLKEKSLVIAFSQSGETVDIISAVKRAQEKDAKILSITNTYGSTLFRMSTFQMLLQAGPEKCVLATKSFTAKIAVLLLLAHALEKNYTMGRKQVELATQAITHLLKNTAKIQALAQKLKNREHIYILGRGLSYPAALESALKIKEGSYIHAEGFAAGELKHGVIALIEKGTPVIVYNPTDETYEDTLSSAHEVKARGAYVIGVSAKPNDVYDEFIEVPYCESATIIPNVVVAQILGYYLTLARGFDPDKPRNLAKSVTVK